MSKIRTIEELSRFLDDESSWRKGEISLVLRNVVGGSGDWQKTLGRIGIVLLYAHWEGFVKKTCEKYVQLIANRIVTKSISLGELSMHFRALILWKRFNKKTDTPVVNFVDVLQEYALEDMSQVCRLQYDGLVNTENNLSLDVFRRLTRVLALDVARLISLVQVIDAQVTAPRHEIAHGGPRLAPSLAEYQDHSKNVVNAIDQFKDILLDCALQEQYLQAS